MTNTIKLFLKLYGLSLGYFLGFRLILFFMNLDELGDASNSEILQAFIMGIRFDLVICSYILLLPFLLMSLNQNLIRRFEWIPVVSRHFTTVLFACAFIVSSADIPWFNEYHSRMNMSAFQWIDHPEMMTGMIMAEPKYWLFIIPLVIAVYSFSVFARRLFKGVSETNETKTRWKELTWMMLGLILIFFGIRGRIAMKSPIRVGTATFCQSTFLNQLGLNPNFTLMRGYLDSLNPANKRVHFMDGEVALKKVQSEFNIPDNQHHLKRCFEYENQEKPPNIVLVIMEGMSAAKMNRFFYPRNTTPFLDSIAEQGISFDKIYTAGIHTFNGIFSTLYGLPALFMQHPMKNESFQGVSGLPQELKHHGYHNIYFTTHDGQFDNAEGFLLSHGFDQVVEESFYPPEEVASTLGVPDDKMFEHSIPILDSLYNTHEPFFATFMTASDHAPFIIPPYFKPSFDQDVFNIVEYADWSLKQFITKSVQKSWFENTVFIFVADHGDFWIEYDYEMPLAFHHTPFIIYAPAMFPDSKAINKIGGQIDVFPTLLSTLGLSYCNESMGIDLNADYRPYIYFCADDRYGVLDEDYFLIVDSDNTTRLYELSSEEKVDLSNLKPEIVAVMKSYAETHMQAAQSVVLMN